MGQTQEALLTIAKLEGRVDLSLVYCVALIIIHKHSIPQNTAEIEKIEKELPFLLEKGNPLSGLHAAQIAWLCNEIQLANRILSIYPSSPNIDALHAWILLTSGKSQEALDLFEIILSDPTKSFDLTCLSGRALCYCELGMSSDCIQTIARILSRYDFPEFHLEKSFIYISMSKWDLAIDTARNEYGHFPSNLEIYILEAYHALFNTGDLSKAVSYIDLIIEQLITIEKGNWVLPAQLAMLFGTLTCNNLTLFDRTLKLAHLAVEESHGDPNCLAVYGYHEILTRNYQAAFVTIQEALEKDPSNSLANECLIKLYVVTGRFNEAQDSLDLMKDNFSPFSYAVLQASILRPQQYFPDLVKAFTEHLKIRPEKLLFEMPLMVNFEKNPLVQLIQIRADLILECLDLLLVKNEFSKQQVESLTVELRTSLNWCMKKMPGIVPLTFYSSLLYQFVGDLDNALYSYQNLFVGPWIFRQSFSSMKYAALLLDLGNVEQALDSIEESYQNDPQIAKNLEFLVIRAKIDSANGTSIEAINKLRPAFKSQTVSFRLILQTLDLCLKVNQFSAAAEFFRMASDCASSSHEKAELLLRQSYIVAARGQMERGIQLLSKLKKHKKYRTAAYVTEAEINRVFMDDIVGFLDSYRELVSIDNSPVNLVFLADALKQIHDYDSAVNLYEQAFDHKHPHESTLKKLISSLVAAHRFEKAVAIFNNVIGLLRVNATVPLDIVKLMIQLKKYQEAEACLSQAVRVMSPSQLILGADYSEQYGIVMSKLENYTIADRHFRKAQGMLEKVLNTESDNLFIRTLRTRLSNLYVNLAINCENLNQREQALDQYNKAMEFDQQNAAPIVELFRIYKGRYDLERCRKLTSDFLTNNPLNETVALLFTSLETREYSASISCLQNVLTAHPHFYRTLVRFVEICARAGQLQLVDNYLQTTDQSAGMEFVRGLHSLFCGSPISVSLAHFKKAATKSRWASAAKITTFQLLVNPYRKYVWCESGPLSADDNLQMAEAILKEVELPPMEENLCRAQLEMSRNTKESIGKAFEIYQKMLEVDVLNICAIVGSSACLYRLDDKAKAQKMLEHVLSGKPFHENYTFFEEAYLLLAQMTSSDAYFSSTQHLIFLALGLNQSSKKGWEMSATSHMKNKLWSEASVAFQHCWLLSGKSDYDFGYNYAYCAMMARHPDESLSVCREILLNHPGYRDLHDRILVPSFRSLLL